MHHAKTRKLSVMEITDTPVHWTLARNHLIKALLSAFSTKEEIVSAAHQMIYAWVWRPYSKISSALVSASVVGQGETPVSQTWEITITVGACAEVTKEISIKSSPRYAMWRDLHDALERVEAMWWADRERRAEVAHRKADGLGSVPAVVKQVVEAHIRDGREIAVCTRTERKIGWYLAQEKISYRAFEPTDLPVVLDLQWPTPKRFTRAEFMANPREVWEAVAEHGHVDLVGHAGRVIAGISVPKGPLVLDEE